MGKLTRSVKSLSGGLVGLALMLIILFFVLNYVASRGWGPFSTLAATLEARANGSAYSGGAAPVVGIPYSPSMGPAI